MLYFLYSHCLISYTMLYSPYLATPHLIYHAEHYIKSFHPTLSLAGAVAQLQVRTYRM